MLLTDGKLLVQDQNYLVREARTEDLEQIIALMAEDEIRSAEQPDATDGPEHYLEAFGEIDADPAHALIVVEGMGGKIVGTMQLTTLPGLARRAAKRMQIEAVRVASELRGGGLGTQMIRWAICEAEHKGISLIQLTSDAQRQDAHRFYQKLGFTASHVGFKMRLATGQ
ncbi:GNAT family N-acetyltransferase [Glutamicibacter arilaitensis]|uniref:GNAT family N-acetyltransferase n=1 Tax=Glutamicibacter arilaitensis TaxID=256701 RepID=UPI003A91EE76